MAYTQQTWTNNVTVVDKAHMDTIENAIATTAGSDQIPAAQKIVWAGDTNLYRVAAGYLCSDQSIYAKGEFCGGHTTGRQIIIGNQSNSNPTITFGSAGDTNLYRS